MSLSITQSATFAPTASKAAGSVCALNTQQGRHAGFGWTS